MADEIEEKNKEGAKNKTKGTIWQKIMWFIAFAVAFTAVKEGKQWWYGVNSKNNFEGMRETAAKEHPDQPISEAMRDAALKLTTEKLEKESGTKKADTAAGQFIGYYFVNVRTRYDYCKGIGVDIGSYVKAFKANNATLYEKSRVIHGRSPYTADKVELESYRMLLPTMQKTIVDAMGDMAKQSNISEVEVCKAFSDNGEELANEMMLEKVSPALYKAMLEAQ